MKPTAKAAPRAATETPDQVPDRPPATGPVGTYTVEESVAIVRHTPGGDDGLIVRNDRQPGAPPTTAILREATMVVRDCLLLAVGAETAAAKLSSDDAETAWLLELARRARAVDLIPPAYEG